MCIQKNETKQKKASDSNLHRETADMYRWEELTQGIKSRFK